MIGSQINLADLHRVGKKVKSKMSKKKNHISTPLRKTRALGRRTKLKSPKRLTFLAKMSLHHTGRINKKMQVL